ncbi:hypothetical protein MY8738_009154 [Beauveria namnaoensis]
MVDVGRWALLPGRLDQTSPSGFSEVDGRPGKCYVRRVPRGRRPA